jgi:hypothetical protein
LLIVVLVGIGYRRGEDKRKGEEEAQRMLNGMREASEEVSKNSQRLNQARFEEEAKRRSSFPQK